MIRPEVLGKAGLAALAGGVLAAALGTLWVRQHTPSVPTEPEALVWLRTFRAESQAHRARMKAFAEGQRWDDVAAEARALVDLDPLSRDGSDALATAASEAAVAAGVAEAALLGSQGREEDALAAWLKVPQGSFYFGRAALEVRALARGPFAARLRGECLGLVRSDRAAAAARCRAYLDLVCGTRKDPDIEHRVRALERNGSWSCPPDRVAYFQEAEPPASRERRTALRSLYGEGPLAEAVRMHVEEGRTRSALEALRRLGSRDARARPLGEALRRVEAGLREGQGGLLSGKPREAEVAFAGAFAADARVLPGFDSDPVRAARRELSRAFLDEARRALDHRQLRAAFDAAGRSRAADPSSVELGDLQRRLEEEAERRLAGTPSCGEIGDLLAVTQQDAPSHRHALELSTRRGCRRGR